MTEKEIKEACPKECPKCAKEVRVLLLPEGEEQAGVYCRECAWKTKLPGELEPVRDISKMMSNSVFQMLRMSPKNPTVRTLIQDKIETPIPKACKTFSEVVYWLNRVPLKASLCAVTPTEALGMRVTYEYYEDIEAVLLNRNRGIYTLVLSPADARGMCERAIGGLESIGYYDFVTRLQNMIYEVVLAVNPTMPRHSSQETSTTLIRRHDRQASISDADVSTLFFRWMDTNAPDLKDKIRVR